MDKFITTSSEDEFLPYIYSGYFFPQTHKSGNVDKSFGGMYEFLLDLEAFSDIIENDVF